MVTSRRQGGQSLAGLKETEKVNQIEALLRKREKKRKQHITTQPVSTLSLVPPKRHKSVNEFLCSEVQAQGLRPGHTEIPSVSLLFCKEGREWRGDQLFLSNALSSLTIITKVTAINPSALRVTLCYLAALPKERGAPKG